MKSKISHADLLRLSKVLGEPPSEELSLFLNFDSETVKKAQDLELPLTANELINNKEKESKNNRKPQDKNLGTSTKKIQNEYWYVDVVEQLQTDYKPTVVKLKTKDRSLVRPHVDALISFNQAKREIINLIEKSHKSKSINIPLMVNDISQGKVLEKIHRKQNQQLPDVLYLLIDVSARLAPAQPELKQYLEATRALMGKTRLKFYPINDSPTINGELVLNNGLRLSDILQPNNTVLYIGDGGSYSSSSIEDKYCWRQFWNKLSGMNIPNKQIILATPNDADPNLVDALMSTIARCEGPEVDRIRHLRQAIANGGLAEELTVWNHPDIRSSSHFADIKPSQLNKWGAVYKSLDPSIQSSFDNSVSLWRDYIPISTGAMEQLKNAALGIEKIRDPELILKLFGENQHTDSFKSYLGYRRNVIDFINVSAKSNKELEYASRTLRHALYGESKSHYSKEEKTLSIKQQGQSLISSFDKLDKPLARLTTPVLDHKGQLVSKLEFTNQFQKDYKLQTSSEYYHFKKITKPNWADRIWHNASGLFASHQDGTEFQLIPASHRDEASLWRNTKSTHNAFKWASDYGIDNYGLWALLSVKKVDFKFRWIPQGTFLMGSPENEVGRFNNETQHEVTLTQGYWLAETSVTQAQWQEIMNNNPSSSNEKDWDYPVNNVSLDDCQKLITELNKSVPDFTFNLPSEAQWEYACRAGTKTAYWWGDKFDESKANLSDKLKQEDNMPQNSFGLKSMSGNVFEWCVDRLRVFTDESITDPIGEPDSRECVVRGGSWISNARNLRSANRAAFTPDARYQFTGLRLAGGFDPQASNKRAMLTADRRRGAKPVRRQNSLLGEEK